MYQLHGVLNMRELIEDMRNKNWIIDSFIFNYNEVACVVIIQLYQDDDKKPDKFARAEVRFRKQSKMSQILKAYTNYSNISFFKAIDFYEFFNIKRSDSSISARQVFDDFSSYFMRCVPTHKLIEKDNLIEEQAILLEFDKTQTKGRYCYGLMENTGERNRQHANSMKAEMLRSELYEEFNADTRLSFCFSEDAEREKTDDEIRIDFANRNNR